MYAGDVSSIEAWKSLQENPNARIVDVRTTREWEIIGIPDLGETGKDVIFIQWQMFPDMQVNPQFSTILAEALADAGASKDDPVFFLCRSGARSRNAAMAAAATGYTKSFNIEDGFEGDANERGERASINGWQFNGLPWKRGG